MSDLTNKDLDDLDREMSQIADEPRKAPRTKKVEKTETYEEPIEPPEEDLPDGDDYSKPEERALRASREKSLNELIELIGEKGFEEWFIEIYRQSPDEFDGFEMKSTRISKIKTPMRWSALLDKIDSAHGGGTFLVWVKDNMSKSVRRRTIEIDSEPKPCYADCPDYFKSLKDKESSTLTKHEEDLLKLETRRKAAEIERDIKRIEGKTEDQPGGVGDLGGIFSAVMGNNTAMMTTMMENMNATADRNAQQTREMIAKMDDNKAQDPGAAMSSILGPILALVMESGKQSQAMMMQIMQNSSQQMSTMMTAILAGNNQPDQSLEYMKLMSDNVNKKNELSVDLGLALYEAMSDKEVDKDPKIQIMEMVSGMLEKGMDGIGKLWQMKTLQAARSRPSLPAPGAVLAPAAPASPVAGRGPAQSPRPEQAPPARPTPEQRWAGVEQEFLDVPEDDQKLMFTIAKMVEQSEEMPAPEDTFFVRLIVHPQMPDWVFRGGIVEENGADVFVRGWIHGVPDATSLRENIQSASLDAQEMQLLDTTLFSREEKCLWINACLTHLKTLVNRPVEDGPIQEDGEFGEDPMEADSAVVPGVRVGSGGPVEAEIAAGPVAPEVPDEPDPVAEETHPDPVEGDVPLESDAPQDAAPTPKKKPAKGKKD